MPRSNSHGYPPGPHGSSALASLLHAWIVRPLLAIAREQRGATAIFIAVAIIPLFAFIGLAVDTTRGYLVKSRLGTAVDAAALAGGRVFTSANRDADIQMYFTANFPPGYMSAVTEPLVITPDIVNKKLTVSVEAAIPTTFMRLVGIDSIPVSTEAEITISSQNLEVALVLDITGSMAGQRIIDLRAAANELVDIVVQDDQSLFYSKVALAPYSQSVNAGSYADEVRGAPPAPKAIESITKADPAVVRSTNHGFSTGDKIFITNVNNGTTHQANNRLSSAGSSAPTPDANSTRPNFWVVEKIDDDSFSLKRCDDDNDACTDTNDVDSTGWTNHTPNTGSIYCMTAGCQYLAFRRDYDRYWVTWKINDCVTERYNANVTTDAPPSTTTVGPRYQPDAGSGNDCVPRPILPLTSDKSVLHTQIDALSEAGSTAGHIGTAWGWYLLSPTFDNPSPTADPLNWTADTKIWPAGSQPAAYGTPQLMKVAVIMTDGDFNTVYRDGVISQDSTSGSGNSWFKINENATNGNGYTQALALCNAMKAPGNDIVIYTVGLELASIPAAANFINQCATSPSHVYLPESGAEMQDAFRDIAFKISKLRLSK